MANRFSTLFSTRQNYTVLCVFMIFGIVLFFSNSVRSQNVFEGPYSINDTLKGKAQFEFKLHGGDTIKHGQFSFSSVQQTNEEEQSAIGIRYTGHFYENKKVGQWAYRYKKIRPSSKPELQGFELVTKVSGEEYLVNGRFNEGKAHGAWKVMHHLIVDGHSTDTLFSGEIQYNHGMPVGETRGRIDNVQFRGGFNQQGQLDGEWVITQKLQDQTSIEEYRIYNDGVFVDHYFRFLGEKFVISHVGLDYSDVDDKLQVEENISSDILQMLKNTHFEIDSPGEISVPEDLKDGGSNTIIAQSNKVLDKMLHAFTENAGHNIWQTLNGSVNMSQGKLRLRLYPIEPETNSLLNETVELRNDALNIIDSFFNNPQVDINRHSNEDLNFYNETYWVYQENLRKLSPLIDLFSVSSAKYLDRKALFDYLKPELNYPDTIIYDFRDEIFSRPFRAPEVQANDGAISFLHSHTSEIHREVVRVEEEVSNLLEKYQKQSRISEKEERLVQKRDSIIRLFSNLDSRDDYNSYHADITDEVVHRTRKWFQQYAELSIERKLNRIDDLLTCFDEVIELYKQLSKIPLRLSDIDEMYTRTVWNPYTYTDMDERIKERLYRAYENIILPTIWDDLVLSIECGKITDKGKNYERIYQKMLSLREQDTKELEREIRRSNSYAEVSEILSLSLNLDSVKE